MNDNRFNELVDRVLSVIEHLPDPPRERIKREFTKIKEMIMENRPPRIMIIGRRGAGKSSLINAIFQDKVAEIGAVLSQTGKAEWYTLENTKGAIHILDTRGIGDLTKPESANFEDGIDDIKDQIKKEYPDAILFLCKAKEVDAHVSEDVRNVVEIRSFVAERHNYDLPVAAVVTQVDELDPKRVEPPYDNEEKRRNITTAVNALRGALHSSGIESLKIIPVSAYAEYSNGVRSYDNYWNIDVLVEYLIQVLPNAAQLQLARLSKIKKVQRKFARTLVATTATICGGIAATPIPVGDLIPITAAQIGMIIGIGYLSGRDLSWKSAMEFLAALGVNVGIGLALREAARALGKIAFPVGGEVISASVAFSGTWGIGEAAIAYFIEGASVEEAKQMFKKGKEENKDYKEQ